MVNTCYYSEGGKHDCCTHQGYCIFNENRVKLEQKIGDTLREYYELKKLRDSYLKGYYCGNIDYDFLLKKLNLLRHNISRLVQFKDKIINNEVDGYGYAVLESETV